jgi:hypothetical protein
MTGILTSRERVEEVKGVDEVKRRGRTVGVSLSHSIQLQVLQVLLHSLVSATFIDKTSLVRHSKRPKE